MNLGGWIMMVLSVGMVVLLLAYCMVKVMSTKDPDLEEELHDPLDIDTKDHEQ